MKVIKRLIMAAALMLIMPAVSNAAGIQLFYDGANHLYTGSVYKLFVNGNEVQSAMEPIIFNDHALVPVREVFEELGATVDYTGETKCVEVQYGKTYMRLYINDNCAYVNGKLREIPDNVVPKLINKPGGLTKTMVPVRFIGETVGMGVDFDGEDGAIYITSDKIAEPTPTPTPAPTAKPTPAPTAAPKPVKITGIENELQTKTSLKVTVKCDGDIDGRYSDFKLKAPERVVVDFTGIGYDKGDTTTEIKGNGISAVRTGVSSERTRIVIDAENLKSYNVKKTAYNTVEITVNVTGGPTQTEKTEESKNSTSAADYAKGITKAGAADAKKVIMIDAGHGGSDPGAMGELNGKTINEKDLTLSIANKVKAILEANGYATSMTRTGDTLPSLSERPAQANEEGCALFVSIHINAASSEEAEGTEVYWSEQNNGDDYGVTSKEFAGNVLSGMIKYMKSNNRGVRMANWAVIRRSEMPAVLAEVGFISNEAELRKMCSDEYQNKVAKGIAEGIINTIHTVELP